MFKTIKLFVFRFDACIVETTGLADPGPVASTFFLFPHVAARYKLDGVIGVIDAKHLGIHLDEVKEEGAINEAVQQYILQFDFIHFLSVTSFLLFLYILLFFVMF